MLQIQVNSSVQRCAQHSIGMACANEMTKQ